MENKAILKRLKQYHYLKFILSQKNVKEFMEREIRDNTFGYSGVLTVFKNYVDTFSLIRVGTDREPIDKYVGRFVRNYKTLGDSVFSSNPSHETYIDFLNAAFGWANPADAPKNIQAIGLAIESDPVLRTQLDDIHLAAARSDGRTNVDILADSVLHIATSAGLRGNVSELERALREQKASAKIGAKNQSIKIKDLLAQIKDLKDISAMNEQAVDQILKTTKKTTGRATSVIIAEMRSQFSIIGGRLDSLDSAFTTFDTKLGDIHSSLVSSSKKAKKMNIGHIIHWAADILGTGAILTLLILLLAKNPAMTDVDLQAYFNDFNTYSTEEVVELSSFRNELEQFRVSGFDTTALGTLEGRIVEYAKTDRNQDDPAYVAVTTTSTMRSELNYAVLGSAYSALEAENKINQASAEELDAIKKYIANENGEYSAFRTEYANLANDADGVTVSDEEILKGLIAQYAATDDIATYGYSSTETMTLQLNNGVYQRVIAGLNAEIATYAGQVSGLQQEIDDLKSGIFTSAAMQDLMDKIDELMAQNQELSNKISALESQLDDALLSAQEKAALESQLAETRAQLAEKEEALLVSQAEVERLQQENADLTSQLANANSRVEELTDKVAELEDEAVVDKKTIDDLNEQINRLNSQIDQLEKELADQLANGLISQEEYQKALDEIAGLKSELEDAKETISELEGENSNLKAENEALKDQIADLYLEIDDLKSEIEDLKNAASVDAATIQELNARLDALNAELAELQAQYNEAVANGSATAAELAEAKAEIDNLKAELATALANIATLEADNASLTTQVSNLTDTIEELNDLIDTLEAGKNADASVIASLNAAIEALEETVADLEGQLEEAIANGNLTNAELVKVQKELSDAQKALEDARKTAADLQAANDALAAENAQLKEQVEDLTETVDELTADNTDLAGDLKDALAQIKALEDKIAELEGTNSATAAELAEAKAALQYAEEKIIDLYTSIFGAPGNMTLEEMIQKIFDRLGISYDNGGMGDAGYDEYQRSK